MSDSALLKKQPLGGIDRRALVAAIAERGLAVARADLASDLAETSAVGGLDAGDDTCMLLLGGSNGILRALAVQFLFGERVPVFSVHYDSERLQIGPKHAQALRERATEIGVFAEFMNADATSAETIAAVTRALRGRFACVHLINGIAAGAPKRYAEVGPCQVPEIDVAFDAVRQVADFSSADNIRAVGVVEVETATPADIERTNRAMGSSTALWADALAAAKLLVPGRSVVAFADYDFAADDPVYGMGPLAGAKRMQRESMPVIARAHGVRTLRLCYPAMNTTALSAIPGGLLAYAWTMNALVQENAQETLPALARASMVGFRADFKPAELRLDTAYQRMLPLLREASERNFTSLTLDSLRQRLLPLVAWSHSTQAHRSPPR